MSASPPKAEMGANGHNVRYAGRGRPQGSAVAVPSLSRPPPPLHECAGSRLSRSGRPAVGSSHGEGRVIIPDIHSAYLRASKGSLEKSGL